MNADICKYERGYLAKYERGYLGKSMNVDISETVSSLLRECAIMISRKLSKK